MNVFKLILSDNINSDTNYHKVNIKIKLLKVLKTNNTTKNHSEDCNAKYIINTSSWSLTKQCFANAFQYRSKKIGSDRTNTLICIQKE